ncbi:Hypothetical protein GLP15_168 [Giardia lamblia P15]|uniref:DCUN1 domain-containing protein n=1 Tax=Giardia intestinalis (strain P15) TaxID=658858 RepID=E1EY34_GIAIA|nr:Hypothetical protein GLP15_168 [Giardia lamblia P15]
MLPNDFSLPKELQWLETIDTSATVKGDVLTDKIIDIHSTHYSSEAISSARRLWTRVGARASHMGDKYKELLDAIYAKHTIVTISLVCYYCKRSNPRDLVCQDLERFFQTISDVLSLSITDEMLPISDSHIRLLLQYLLSNDETKLTFFDFIFDCNTCEEGTTQVTFENACRVLLVFFSRHKLLPNLLEYFKNSGTTMVSKYLWPMIFNFLSTYSSVENISESYNFNSSIYPLIIDKFCKHIIGAPRIDGATSGAGKKSELSDIPNRTGSTRQCLEDIDFVLFQQHDSTRTDLTPQPESLIRTPNATKRVQFAGIRDDSLLEHPSPPKINLAPSSTKVDALVRVVTPLTQPRKDRPPSALSQKQTELAARLAAFKASSQRRLSGSGTHASAKQADYIEKDTSSLSSPQNVDQHTHSPCVELTKQYPLQAANSTIREASHWIDNSSKNISNGTGSSKAIVKPSGSVPRDKLSRIHSLVKNPYKYLSPAAEIILEARQEIEARQSTREQGHLRQLHKNTVTETAQSSTAPCVATPSISSQGGSVDCFSQTSKLATSAITTPLVTEHSAGNIMYTPLQHQRQSHPTVSDIAAKYTARRSSFRPDCITLQPAQNAAAPAVSLTPSMGTSSTHSSGPTTGMRQLSATAAKYITTQISQASKLDQGK